MFFEYVKNAWEKGEVKVGLSADPADKSVTVISSGLTQLASMFLSKAERAQLGELAKCDARSQQ